ncbi:MAG: hypothetical protein ACTHLX_14395 [Candidatus Binatia bacterium]
MIETHAGGRAQAAVRLPSLGSQPPQGKSLRTGGAVFVAASV